MFCRYVERDKRRFGEVLCNGILTVRRQGFWNHEQRKLKESLAHLIGLIMRRIVCDASDALRVSVV